MTVKVRIALNLSLAIAVGSDKMERLQVNKNLLKFQGKFTRFSQ
jgi:hypothetical protein